mgnify:CR=1 FL=1
MDANQLYQKIENYLTGNMSAEESSQFEEILRSDPAVRQEMDFQRSVIEGVKQYRKQQIKASLSEVTISPWTNFLSSGLGKAAIGIIVPTLIGGTIYLTTTTGDSSEELSIGKEIIIDAPEKNTIPKIKIEEKSEERIAESRSEDKTLVIQAEEPATDNTSGAEEETFTPQITLPEEIDEVAEDTDFESDEISQQVYTAPVPESEGKVDVNVENTDSGIMKYRYFEGKLNLYGNFKDTTYQLLEVIGSDGKELYLFYKDAYYELNSGSEIQVLTRISNQKKIDQLEILKNHK